MNPTDITSLPAKDITDTTYVIGHNSLTHVSNKISLQEIIDYVAQQATKKVVENLGK